MSVCEPCHMVYSPNMARIFPLSFHCLCAFFFLLFLLFTLKHDEIIKNTFYLINKFRCLFTQWDSIHPIPHIYYLYKCKFSNRQKYKQRGGAAKYGYNNDNNNKCIVIWSSMNEKKKSVDPQIHRNNAHTKIIKEKTTNIIVEWNKKKRKKIQNAMRQVFACSRRGRIVLSSSIVSRRPTTYSFCFAVCLSSFFFFAVLFNFFSLQIINSNRYLHVIFFLL